MLWLIFITIRDVLLLLTTIFVLFVIILKTSKKVQDKWFAFLLVKMLKIDIEKNIAEEKEKLFTELKLVKSKDPERLRERKVKILEIGAGSGSNFKYYPDNTSLICVEPNDNFQKYFQANNSKFPNVKLDLFICSGAEDMKEIEDDSVDVVVATHVLCSVNNVQKVLQEVKRVLMKGSRFYYYDHQISPETNFTVIFSKIIEPVWKILGGNCHLTRDIGNEVERAGFEEVSQYYKYIDKFPFIVRYHVFGYATK
ncbi:thiol S-methyltransferase TMT1B-like [Centruroides vittatus]|uniref:thiol S-methyltransferase TMT1B-like n=1 Tax=Centruroides vittatus TaxID=120091 RepID=UPI00350FF970